MPIGPDDIVSYPPMPMGDSHLFPKCEHGISKRSVCEKCRLESAIAELERLHERDRVAAGRVENAERDHQSYRKRETMNNELDGTDFVAATLMAQVQQELDALRLRLGEVGPRP